MNEETALSELSKEIGFNFQDRALVQKGKVTNLDLSHTKVENLEFLENFTSLQWLYCNNCTKISSLKPLSKLTNLKELALKGCTSITDLEPLRDLEKLEILFLDGCTGIKNIKALGSLFFLRELTLPHTFERESETEKLLVTRGVNISR